MTLDKKYRYEYQLQSKAAIEIKKRYGFDCWYYHPRESKGGRKAVPDIILCFYGIFVAIELKRDLSVRGPTKLQTHNIKLIKRAGGYAMAFDTLDQMFYQLDIIKKHILEERSNGKRY